MITKFVFIVSLMLSIFIVSINGINFSALFIVTTIWIISVNFCLNKIVKKKPGKFLTLITKAYNLILILFLSSFIIIESLLLININNFKDAKDLERLDYVIVLGAGLDGYSVSKVLKSRLDKAIEYYNIDKNTNIIVSGGQGKDEIISEAEAMYRYLVVNGVDRNKIIKEDRATTTLENMVLSNDILKARNDEDKKVLIVTNDFHLTRSQIIANILGIKNEGLPSYTKVKTRVNYLIREYPTLIIDLIRAINLSYKY